MTTEVEVTETKPTPPAQTAKIENLDEEYVRELRSENKTIRKTARDLQDKLEALEAEHKAKDDKLAEYETKLSDFTVREQVLIKERAMDSLERHFERLNLRDPEFLKLIPQDKLVLDETGKLTNGQELAEEYRKDKPDWFRRSQTSSTATTPAPAKAESLKGSELARTDPKAYLAERKRLFGG
jgi:hypothetical protein